MGTGHQRGNESRAFSRIMTLIKLLIRTRKQILQNLKVKANCGLVDLAPKYRLESDRKPFDDILPLITLDFDLIALPPSAGTSRDLSPLIMRLTSSLVIFAGNPRRVVTVLPPDHSSSHALLLSFSPVPSCSNSNFFWGRFTFLIRVTSTEAPRSPARQMDSSQNHLWGLRVNDLSFCSFSAISSFLAQPFNP